MFARNVSIHLKSNMFSDYTRTFENDILPLLRRQKGFLDEIIMLAPEKTELVAISLWETKEFAEIYNREFYPEVVKILNKYVEGFPVLKTFEVEYATLPTFVKYAKVAVA